MNCKPEKLKNTLGWTRYEPYLGLEREKTYLSGHLKNKIQTTQTPSNLGLGSNTHAHTIPHHTFFIIKDKNPINQVVLFQKGTQNAVFCGTFCGRKGVCVRVCVCDAVAQIKRSKKSKF